MQIIIEILKFTLFFTASFLIFYLPIEKKTKNKAWYYRGLCLFGVTLVFIIYAKYFAGPIGCFLNKREIKCGVDHVLFSFVMAVFFSLMGLIILLKERYELSKNRK